MGTKPEIKKSLKPEIIAPTVEDSSRRSKDQSAACCTNSTSGPRTSLGPVTLTVRVVLGPGWGPLH